MAKMGVDYSKLSPELVKKLKKIEANKPEYKQLRATEDLIETIAVTDEGRKKEHTEIVNHFKGLGALFTDVREQLVALNKKELPKPVDSSDKVIKALKGLGEQLSKKIEDSKVEQKIEVKSPTVKVPKTELPEITLPPPQVNVEAVDLKPLENKLKMIPAQFAKAIKSIPRTDNSGLESKLDTMIEWLESLDNQARRRPEPGVMPIVNKAGTTIDTGSGLVSEEYDYVDVEQTSATVETYTYRTGGASGTIVAVVVITYTDATKNEVDYMERASTTTTDTRITSGGDTRVTDTADVRVT